MRVEQVSQATPVPEITEDSYGNLEKSWQAAQESFLNSFSNLGMPVSNVSSNEKAAIMQSVVLNTSLICAQRADEQRSIDRAIDFLALVFKNISQPNHREIFTIEDVAPLVREYEHIAGYKEAVEGRASEEKRFFKGGAVLIKDVQMQRLLKMGDSIIEFAPELALEKLIKLFGRLRHNVYYAENEDDHVDSACQAEFAWHVWQRIDTILSAKRSPEFSSANGKKILYTAIREFTIAGDQAQLAGTDVDNVRTAAQYQYRAIMLSRYVQLPREESRKLTAAYAITQELAARKGIDMSELEEDVRTEVKSLSIPSEQNELLRRYP